ncbi:6-phospho-beta-glucosidase [uncultured Pseudokineococcus sp.]|uniref:6-phospho-beta-glucosidase n=1 Tax=uncultured Pseudokineococcus sp. TaxID=1642928 RepID=UPI00262B2349|nr:6-phospho-beta-glucosidase [uncultured Pseudokineococcus sp.]
MKLVLVGGGGFRVPQVVEAVGAADAAVRVDEVHLHDVSPARLAVVRSVLEQLAQRLPHPPRISAGTDLDEALRGADFVFSAMRIGGTAGRVLDERVALDLGVLGQETVGPGGLAYALRTLPHARHLAERVRAVAPDAWVISFTNPAGIVTEAMRAVLGERVVGICDTPIGLVRRAARAVGATSEGVTFDYAGLNHLGWLRSLQVDGRERLPDLLADDEALDGIEEARTLGVDWVRTVGALPNEYLYYYSYPREATERLRAAAQTRGQFLDAQQGDFYARAAAHPERALETWESVHRAREASYMAESRPEPTSVSAAGAPVGGGSAAEGAGAGDRRAEDLEGGGYQRVALDLMAALVTGRTATMILDVANDGVLPCLPDEAVVEVPCTVDAEGVHPHAVAPLTGDMLGLVQQVKASEQLLLEASATRSRELAWRAFAAHPLVDSVAVARLLLDGYREALPEVGRALD